MIQPPLRRVLASLSLVAAAALLVRGLLPQGGATVHHVVDHGLYFAVELAGGLACVARAVLVPRRRLAWSLLAAAVCCWLTGTAIWGLGEEGAAYPAAADLFFVAFCPLAGAGTVLLLSGRRSGKAGRLWMDGAIGGLAVGALLTALLWDDLRVAAGSGLSAAFELAYPIADVVLLGLVLVAFATQGWRPSRGWLLLGAGFAAIATADLFYVLQTANDSHREGTAIGALWPIALLCFGWAAWQPWPRPRPELLLRRELFLFPALFALLAVGIIVAGQLWPVPLPATLLALGSLLLGFARAGSNYRTHMALLAVSQREARTDGLTGLSNRRALLDDLDAALAEGERSVARTLVFFDLDGFKRYNDRFGHVAGDILLHRLAETLRRAVDGDGGAYRLGGDEFCVLLDGAHDDDSAPVRRCRAALEERGEAFAVTASFGCALLPRESADPSRALGIADARMYEQKAARRPGNGSETSDALKALLREREPELGDHSDGVGDLAVAVARRLGIAGEALDAVARAAELHDIGKIAVPEAILHKAGPLDDDEWQLMRQHTVIGDRILSAAPAMRDVARMVRASHERWDGRGYPDGLAGEAIPLGARIVAVCDAYSAMTSDRPYQEPQAHAAAVAELRRCAGVQFDPRVVDAFCAVTFTAVAAAAATRP